jgi:DNA polymerase beta
MGLKYYESILERIPRAEMMQHETFLKSVMPKGTEGVIVGSYRRQAESSGDIDMLLRTEGTAKQQKETFRGLIKTLTDKKYILDILALGEKKCMAVVALPDGKERRLDLLFTPQAEYAYSILYFTGSDAFNVAFRKHALTLGYTLNEHTLKPTAEKPVPPPMPTEEAIFTFLGLQYVAPENRKGEESLVKV